MPDEKISSFQNAVSVTGAEFLTGLQSGSNKNFELDFLKDFFSTSEVQDLTVEGTTSTTTAKAIYGINTVLVSSNSDFCTRLPLVPIKGKVVTFVNTSTRPIRVFPSVTGGKINGIVNGFFDVPNDALAYSFTCYENPNPGDWSTPIPKPASTFINFPVMTVSHTTGSVTFKNGVGVSGSGVGLAISYSTPLSMYYIVLSPNSSFWKTENSVQKVYKLNVYTNILQSDITGSDRVDMWLTRGYQNSSNSVTSGQLITVTYSGAPYENPDGSAGTYIVSNGTINTPSEIGDINTIYGFKKGFSLDIGNNAPFGNYYYTFGMQLSAGCPTKDYKFKFELEII